MIADTSMSHRSMLAGSLERFGFSPVHLNAEVLTRYRALALADVAQGELAHSRGRQINTFVEAAKVPAALDLIAKASCKLVVFAAHKLVLDQMNEALGQRCQVFSHAGLQQFESDPGVQVLLCNFANATGWRAPDGSQVMAMSIPMDIGPSVAPSYFQALGRTRSDEVAKPAITLLANVDQDVRAARLLAAQTLSEEALDEVSLRAARPGEHAPHGCDADVVCAALLAYALEAAKRGVTDLQAIMPGAFPR